MFICCELHAYCLTIRFNRWPLDQIVQLRCSLAPAECFRMPAPLFACYCNCVGLLLSRRAILVYMACNDRKVYPFAVGLVMQTWDQGQLV